MKRWMKSPQHTPLVPNPHVTARTLPEMRELIALALPGGRSFVEQLLRAWDDGDAVLPVDPRLPRTSVEELLATMRPACLVDDDGERTLLEGAIPLEEDDALVVPTSGSSGPPKGVVHTHAGVAASARATNAGIGTDPEHDRVLACLPLAHVAGLSAVTRALLSGTPLEVHPGFDADAVEHAARRGATITTLVPTALARIDPALFRRIVVGGAAPSGELPPNCLLSYGLTETGSAVCYDGRPLAGAEVRIVQGEIQVRGPMLLRAYRDGTDPKDPDGWLGTGDLGELDPDHRLVVHGRRDHLIISGGENVWPERVEAVLAKHPGVAEVAVVGEADAEWGARVVAIVVPEPGQTPPRLDELRELAASRLPRYSLPRGLRFARRLPRTALGKIRRGELASIPWSAAEP